MHRNAKPSMQRTAPGASATLKGSQLWEIPGDVPARRALTRQLADASPADAGTGGPAGQPPGDGHYDLRREREALLDTVLSAPRQGDGAVSRIRRVSAPMKGLLVLLALSAVLAGWLWQPSDTPQGHPPARLAMGPATVEALPVNRVARLEPAPPVAAEPMPVQAAYTTVTQSPSVPSVITHVVRKGDTLWDIALRYHRDPFDYMAMAKLSHIENPDLIYPGDVVRLSPG